MQNMQKRELKILLLSAPIGAGHRLAAQALQQELEGRSTPELKIQVEHGNVFDFFPGFLGRSFLACYLKVLQLCPWLYEMAYSWGNRGGGSLWLRQLINRVLAALGSGYLRRMDPKLVIATHATPAGIMSLYKQRHPNLWLGAVITDFTIHRWWLCQGVDMYFLSHPLLLERLPKESSGLAYGIPLRREFSPEGMAEILGLAVGEEHVESAKLEGNAEGAAFLDAGKSKQEARAEDTAEFAPAAMAKEEGAAPRILLLGGGEGLLPMDQLLPELLQLRKQLPNLELVAVTGRNAKLEQQLRQQFGGEARVSIYGFRQDLPQLMLSSNLIITKAGGLSCAEILACGRRLLLYKPLPGQESRNAEFLTQHCGARMAASPKELAAAVQELLAAPQPGAEPSLAAKKIVDYLLLL